MDFSDLPRSAQDRITAAETEADSIAADFAAAAVKTADTFQFGVDPLGIDRLLYGDPLAVRAARQQLADGRERAAGHLLGAVASQYLKHCGLDLEKFDAKLEVIGGWVVNKYSIDHSVLIQMKRVCRGTAFRMRAAALETAAAAGGPPKTLTPRGTEPGGNEPTHTEAGPAVNSPGGNGADRRAAVDAYIGEVFRRTGKRITRTDIWRSARYKSRTEFERWERQDRRATKAADERFTRILAEKPHLR